MIIFDKAQWHIDAGEEPKEVIEKFNVLFAFLDEAGFLVDEGKELLDIGIDSSAVIHERMVTAEGNSFLMHNYDSVINASAETLKGELQKLFSQGDDLVSEEPTVAENADELQAEDKD